MAKDPLKLNLLIYILLSIQSQGTSASLPYSRFLMFENWFLSESWQRIGKKTCIYMDATVTWLYALKSLTKMSRCFLLKLNTFLLRGQQILIMVKLFLSILKHNSQSCSIISITLLIFVDRALGETHPLHSADWLKTIIS